MKTEIEQIADRYEKEYGFMAVNATMENARKMDKIHAYWTVKELKQVNDELLRRGHQIITTPEAYELGCRKYGVPPAFKNGLKSEIVPRTIRYMTKEQARRAGQWVIKKYHTVFERLAKH